MCLHAHANRTCMHMCMFTHAQIFLKVCNFYVLHSLRQKTVLKKHPPSNLYITCYTKHEQVPCTTHHLHHCTEFVMCCQQMLLCWHHRYVLPSVKEHNTLFWNVCLNSKLLQRCYGAYTTHYIGVQFHNLFHSFIHFPFIYLQVQPNDVEIVIMWCTMYLLNYRCQMTE